MAEILVVDDDAGIRGALADLLEAEGYEVRTAADGMAALEAWNARRPDLMLLDVMMPKKSGYDVCREIRKTDERLPIIMLTAKQEPADEVMGLDRGATDYVKKPFSNAVLLQRISTQLRQLEIFAAAQQQAVAAAAATSGDLETLPDFAFGSHTVRPGSYRLADARGRETSLTPREVDVLWYLARPGHAGNALRRVDILEACWANSDDIDTDRVVDMLVMGLRRKLGKDGALIESVRGVGYRYVG